MKRLTLTFFAVSVVAVSAIAGSAISQQPSSPTPAPMSGMGTGMMALHPGDSASTKGYKMAMMKMMEGMPMMKFTGDADVDFMTQMRVHHQGAIDMAKVVLANGKDAMVKKLAQDIIAAQEKEIMTIDAWLKGKSK